MIIHHMVCPGAPDLVEARVAVWTTIASSPDSSVAVRFKHKNRWYRCRALLNTGLTFTYESNGKLVTPKVEAGLLRFLVSESP